MSFYEDNVADGSHCGSCCQYIGEDVGYPRFCKDCGGDSGGATKSQKKSKKAARLEQFRTWLQVTGIQHAVKNDGYHFVLTLPGGVMVDAWPSTGKWQQRGKSVSNDPGALSALYKSLAKPPVQNAHVEELLLALNGCIEHMEWSNPNGERAYRFAKQLIERIGK